MNGIHIDTLVAVATARHRDFLREAEHDRRLNSLRPARARTATARAARRLGITVRVPRGGAPAPAPAAPVAA